MAQQSCAMGPRWRIFGDFFGPAFSASQTNELRWKQHLGDALMAEAMSEAVNVGFRGGNTIR